ncbi:cytidine deaminase [Gallaecimonas mangrovi]|uniref:cytidine deaminase n=1 Tax=Gallaecimonas mangrovi TaxID=2291597 RepID=UPI000E20A88A|nr:cytidine deaminase [Gallaecimonas mangrovi]
MNNALLADSLPLIPTPLQPLASAWLKQQPFIAQLSPEQVRHWCALSGLAPDQLMLALLPLARCFANAPISHFFVGAIVEGSSGIWYLGANQEYAPAPLGMTIHAEQCAITHARQSGETKLTSLAVNYSPCGHCRQFMSELSEDLSLRVLLPGKPVKTLADYLPEAFGPWDLAVKERPLAIEDKHFNAPESEALVTAAVHAASISHAPYTQTFAGVAMRVGDAIVTGSYIENAAYNPSLPPCKRRSLC